MKSTLFSFIVLFCSLAFAQDACKENILKTTCLVESQFAYNEVENTLESIQRLQNRTCLAESESYAQELYDLYEQFPSHTKTAFCHVKKIYIVPGKVSFGALAQLSYDLSKTKYSEDNDGNKTVGLQPDGYILSISKYYRFDLRETAEEYANRVFQQAFGVDVFNDGLSSDLPKITIRNNNKTNPPPPSSLLATLIHEVGHFLDYSSRHTGEFSYVEDLYYQNSEWTPLGWYGEGWPRPMYVEPLVDEAQPYQPSGALSYYIPILRDSPFTTFYALAAPEEDFAEHYLFTLLDAEYVVWDGDHKVLSNTHRDNYEFNQKTEYIKSNLEPGFINFKQLSLEWRHLHRVSREAGQICKHPK